MILPRRLVLSWCRVAMEMHEADRHTQKYSSLAGDPIAFGGRIESDARQTRHLYTAIERIRAELKQSPGVSSRLRQDASLCLVVGAHTTQKP
jgi:hypothetical protein